MKVTTDVGTVSGAANVDRNARKSSGDVHVNVEKRLEVAVVHNKVVFGVLDGESDPSCG